MINITKNISIHENELTFNFIRSSGPGGQNVNRVASAVQLRFNINASSLPENIKKRLRKLGGSKVTKHDDLIIEAKRFRNQEKNRKDAVKRLIRLIRKAAKKPKPRKKTKPPPKAHKKRLKEKQKQSEKKKLRKKINKTDYK
ncbi:MAG: alternative ribosome rescue aminoacyl-tRNA hydrolase ArfB [bacterium]